MSDIMPKGRYYHANLGIVVIDDACVKMQEKNPDTTSVFVNDDGEIKEVSMWMVTRDS